VTKAPPFDAGASFAFSPSGDWFVTAADGEVEFWRSDTWEPGPKSMKFGGPIAFSDSGSLFAMTEPPFTIVLVSTPKPGSSLRLDDPDHILLRLENPDRKQVRGLAFNNDGSKLAVISSDQLVFVWDLALISQGLSNLNLKGNLAFAQPASAL
jgi:WD40 repeat protein